MKIVFFGTANVALPILEELNKDHQILAVVTNPDAAVGRSSQLQESPVSALAKDLGFTTFKPEKVKGNTEFLNELQKLNADIFVVVAFGTILPNEVINMPPLKTVNVHFSVLPKYRGPSPIQAALLNGDRQTGTSIFLLDEKVDNGPLLGQKIVNIDPEDNYFTLSDKLAKISAHFLLDVLQDYKSGKLTPLPQDEAAATHTKIITKEDGKANWNKSAVEIYNQFRAFYIWPGIWTTWNGKKIKILDCSPEPAQNYGTTPTPAKGGVGAPTEASGQMTTEPGTTIDDGKVVCGGGTVLQIKSLQPEGKSEMDIFSFLNGYRDFVGSKLGL